MSSSHGGLLTIAMYHHRETIHYDETEKRAHNSQIVRAKENLKLSQGGPATTKHQALYARAIIESET